jgi:hypothetical protein
MRQLFVAVLLVITSLSIQARNVNPRHKLTVVMENYVLQTEVGQALQSELLKVVPRFDYVYGCTIGNINNVNCPYKKAFKIKSNHIVIHPDFHAASYEYHSWIMVLAMAKMVYEKRYELNTYSRLRIVEVEQMVFLTAQKYWQQLGAPMRGDLDYYHCGKIGEIARSLSLSIRAFTRSYNENNLLFFFNKVATRAKKYDGIRRSADDIISGDYSNKEKDIARAIKIDLHSDLTRIVEF